MPTITRLTRQKKDPNRINIYLDGQYSFALDLETVTRHHLKPKLNLTQEQINQLLHQGEFQRFYNLALKLIARRPRSESELDTWFHKKSLGPQLVDQIKAKLHQHSLIDDLEFARWWISQRQNHRPKGPHALRQELLSKGISNSLINQVLQQTDFDADTLRQVAAKKLRTLTRYDSQQQKQKLTAFLLRRGYDFNQIKPIIDELMAK